jgi:adenylate cyclase
VAQLGLEREKRGLPAQRVGIGVHVGDAVVGSMGASMRLDYTAIGPCVNLASRLCGLAKAGEVLSSVETAQPLAALLDLEPATEVRVKGFSEPVAVCRVLGER